MAIFVETNSIFETLHVGDTFHNSNGEDYIVVAINKEKDRTLLVRQTEKGTPFYVGAWGIGKHSWAQGHYFMDNFEEAALYINEN